ncbi:MAG TPA: EamA family transporter [Verrucomicrobiae bacterium]|nr:EamA family transporter [Verrucomicrobiae bacterium]
MPRWLLWSFVAVLCWGYWAVISRLIGDALTAAQSQALSTIGLVPVVIALAASRRLTASGNRRRGIAAAFCAGMLACAGNVAYYHALKDGGSVSTLVSFTALYPLVTVLLAMLLLRERLNRFQIVGVGLSLVAIGLFNVTGDEGLVSYVLFLFNNAGLEGVEIASGWLRYAFIPIALWGVAGLLQKISTNHISGELSTVGFLAAFVPVALIILFFQPISGNVTLNTWFLVTALGLSFSLGNLAILAAFANAGKASVITPLTGLYPVVSVPIAILFLGEKITARETAAIALALVSVVALSYEKPTTKGTSSL